MPTSGKCSALALLALVLVPSASAAEPVAFFTLTAQTVRTGSPLTADASASTGEGNLTYAWAFEGDLFVEGNVTATHVYRQDGVKTIRLRITDGTGSNAEAVQQVLVTGSRPQPYFTVTLTRQGEGAHVLVNATFSEPSRGATRIVKYDWSWGDGTNTTAGNVTEEHVYADVGRYLVTLRVTDDEGRFAEVNEPVIVGGGFLQRAGRVWAERDAFLKGTIMTLKLAVIAIVAGFFLAVVIALCRVSRFPLISWPATAYVEFLRGTPLLVQILIAWLALPYVGIRLPIFWAGAVALIVNTSAYQAEVIRAGIQSIPSGQMEAALGLGMTRTQAMRHVVLPQAFRLVLPPLGNEFIILLKDTSLVSVIGVVELTQIGQLFSGRTFLVLETWLGVALVYFVLTYSLSLALRATEKRLKIPGLGIEGVAH